MFLFVLAISATESWMFVTDLVYHMGLAQYDTRFPSSTRVALMSAGRAVRPLHSIPRPLDVCI
jgi:hypothetical protein